MNMVKIGLLAEETGVGIETLRFYERRGLLQPAARTANGYRLYGADELRRVVLIRAAQSLGFTLREIKELIGVGRSQVGCAELQSAVDVKLEDIDRRISALQQTRRRLKAVRRSCSGGRELCPAVARIGQSGRREQSSLA